jgi:hypothetical protein
MMVGEAFRNPLIQAVEEIDSAVESLAGDD